MCPSENLGHRSPASQKEVHWNPTSLLRRISFPPDFHDSSKWYKWKINNRQTALRNTSSPWKGESLLVLMQRNQIPLAFLTSDAVLTQIPLELEKVSCDPLYCFPRCLSYSAKWLCAGQRVHWFAVISMWKVLGLQGNLASPASGGALGDRWDLLCFGSHYHQQRVSTASCSQDDTNNCLPWPPTLALIFTDASVGLFKRFYRRCTKCDGSCPSQLSWLSKLTKAHSSRCRLWSCLSDCCWFFPVSFWFCLLVVFLFICLGFFCT